MPSRSHLNSYPPKEKPKKTLTKVLADNHPITNRYEQDYSTYKARAHEGPIIKTPPDRAHWRRAYATPSHRVSDEDEYVDDIFSPSPSPQNEDSGAPIILLDGCVAKGKTPCFINDANKCATLASQSPNLASSDDESDGCVTPASCSSSVYSQDESDMDTRRLEYLDGTNRPFTGSKNICVTPALSTSSSVYSQDEGGVGRVEAERDGTETVGYYELPEIAHYFGECQQSEGKGSEENVEEDYSLAIDMYYR
ncbi:hypothetical protein MKX08_002018 [Trichoderma sp. CBMAI-0020]|nr:hypothetical protein MKX08_002018 [Trichoderma sp. CBMAI-0020]